MLLVQRTPPKRCWKFMPKSTPLTVWLFAFWNGPAMKPICGSAFGNAGSGAPGITA